MCVWCVILMVLYALHPTYAGVVWLKPLADYVPPTKAKSMQRLVPTQSKYAVKPEPQPEPTPRARWVPRPHQESCGYRHMDVAWDPAPAPSGARRRQLAPIDNDAESVEYRLGYRRLAGPGEGQQPREEVTGIEDVTPPSPAFILTTPSPPFVTVGMITKPGSF